MEDEVFSNESKSLTYNLDLRRICDQPGQQLADKGNKSGLMEKKAAHDLIRDGSRGAQKRL